MLALLLNGLPTIATVILVIAYVPQIIKTYRTKDVTGVSLLFWVLMNIALSLMLVNAITIFIQFGTWGYAITEIANLSLAAVMFVMVIVYREKGEEGDRRH